MTTQRLPTRAMLPLTVGSLFYLFYWAFVGVYDPFLNVYFANLGLTGFQIGIIGMTGPLAILLWSPLVSSLADRWHKRVQFLQWSLVGWGIMVAVMAFPQSFWLILPLVFITALLRSPTNPLSDSLIASMAVRRRLSFGRMRMWGSLGFALVTIIGGYVWVQTGYRPMFAAALLLALPAIYFAGKLEGGPVVNSQNRGPVLDLLRDPGLLTLFIISFLMGAALLSTYIFGGIYMQQMSGNEFMIGLLFGLSALIEVPVMHVSSDIITRLTAVRTFWLSLVVFALSLVGYALATSAVLLISAGVVKGVGYALFFVTLVRLIDERAPDEWKSTAQAISSACFMGLSPLLTSALSGYVFDTWGGHMLYVGAFLLAITAVLLMSFALSKRWFEPIAQTAKIGEQ